MKIIQGTNTESRILRLEKAVKVKKSGKEVDLGSPAWATYDENGRWKKPKIVKGMKDENGSKHDAPLS